MTGNVFQSTMMLTRIDDRRQRRTRENFVFVIGKDGRFRDQFPDCSVFLSRKFLLEFRPIGNDVKRTDLIFARDSRKESFVEVWNKFNKSLKSLFTIVKFTNEPTTLKTLIKVC